MPRTWRFSLFLLPALLAVAQSAAAAQAASAPDATPSAGRQTDDAAAVRKKAIDLGSWGEIEVGQTDSPSRRLVVTTPVRDPWFVDDAYGGMDARAAYYSPRVSGFRVGLGYTPVLPDPGEADSVARHRIEGVVRHDGRLGKAKLHVTAGGGKARVTSNGRRTSRKTWVVGGQVAARGLTVGAGYRGQTAPDGPDRHTLNAGVRYESSTDARSWSVTGRVAHTQAGDETAQEAWSTGLRFRVTPKFSLSADLGTMTYDGDPAASTMLRIGTRVVF
ncbi:porin [Azospirillum soli]|uniref:porin n=1 Tax=Azospirillum soli TaxID=1304799 RepID=UPI001AE5DEB8|nr:porin [Azospirillum soli]MBP2314418.1 hypothetical protein [Azospirillum soli]